jgi:acyl-CoA dehydrogenase
MSTSVSDNGLLEETLTRLFSEHSDAASRQVAESSGWMPGCWEAMAESGLIWIGVPEAVGGLGGDLDDVCTLIRLAGRHAVPLPLAECTLIGGWLAALAGLQLPNGPLTVAIPRSDDALRIEGNRVRGRLSRVPWANQAAAVVAVADGPSGPRVVLIDPTQVTVAAGHNLAGEPRDSLHLDGITLENGQIGIPPSDPSAELLLRGGLSRTLLMAGAMETITTLTIDYASQRHQFGRAIASFQAVAQRLVQMSAESEMAVLAGEVAARRFADVGVDATFEVAAANATVSRAASEVAAHAHQVHAAIGMTQEYPLHHFTRRLWAWRQEWGSERYWSEVLGQQVVICGADGLWANVTTGLEED